MSLLSDMIEDFIRAKGANKLWFANEVGASQNTVSRWLQDKNWPKEHMKAIQRVMNLSDDCVKEIAKDWRQSKSNKGVYRIAGTEFVSRKFRGSYEAFVSAVLNAEREASDGISERLVGDVKQWAPIFRATPDLWRVLVRDDVIVGSWQIVPLQHRYIEQIKAGTIVDSDLTVNMVDFTFLPERYQAYFPMIAISRDESNPASRRIMCESVTKAIRDNAVDGIFFSEIVAIGVSTEGKQLCRRVGMEPMGAHPSEENAELFSLSGRKMPGSTFGRDLTIRETYSKHFRR